MPALKAKPFEKNERLIEISELKEWMQPAFSGMKSLNRIQSRVCNTALYTSENILMCAPTGAGKTNVAMLTILHEVCSSTCHALGAYTLVSCACYHTLITAHRAGCVAATSQSFLAVLTISPPMTSQSH